MEKPFLIAGGGIGGLACALALARKGFAVRLFEQQGEFREAGAGIQLGPNMFKALERLDLKDAVLADAWQPGAQEMRCALSGKLVARIPLEEEFRAKFKEPYGVTHRHDLLAAYLKACKAQKLISLETSRRVESFRDEGARVVVTLSNGDEVEGEALIGSDGVWSRVREQIVGDGAPIVSGHIAYRAVLKKSEVPEDLWQPDVVLWAGPRTHLVHYPLRRGELYNLVAVFHSKQYVEGWDAAGDTALLWRHFKGQRPEVLRMLERIETWRMWVLCDREPVKNWSKGRVTLLGDAAHPMLQYLAQGANMATEDAVVLAEKLSEAKGDVAAACTAYQEARYKRTAWVQIMARIYGELYHAEGVKAELRNESLGARTPQDAYKGVEWLYAGI
ncbi:MAG: 3-hydroxybenzoate 6-monooxygenase [Rhizobiales bacterium]|nr:3-hydroxybenzoate 6-monooxygenase [Hyphomicrobiales bacterium]